MVKEQGSNFHLEKRLVCLLLHLHHQTFYPNGTGGSSGGNKTDYSSSRTKVLSGALPPHPHMFLLWCLFSHMDNLIIALWSCGM